MFAAASRIRRPDQRAGDLDRASAELHAALEESDRARLNRASALLGRVLNVYPEQINTRLNETARTLRLPSLAGAMTVIRDRIVTLELDPDRVAQFVEGVSGLTSLNAELGALLAEHDRWQLADGELHLVQSGGDRLLDDLQAAWPRLRELTEPLYLTSGDEWATNFRQDCEKLQAALDARNPARARDCFRRYRRSAGLRFFEVDVRLKEICTGLLTVGEPLVSVLRMLE